MPISLPAALQTALSQADASTASIDERDLASKLNATVADDKALPQNERKGLFAIVGGLYFMRARREAERVWDMYWQPVQTFKTQDGRDIHSPAVKLVDEEVIDAWGARSAALRHPVLRARYADLAWEIGRYRREDAKAAGAAPGSLPRRPEIAWAHWAIDSYLDAVERRLVSDDFLTWMTLGRAIELATSVSGGDRQRLDRAKRLLFAFRADCEARDPTYPFWPFDDIAWDLRRPLNAERRREEDDRCRTRTHPRDAHEG